MRDIWKITGILLIASVVLLSGCKKKKPPVPRPQELPPTITLPQPIPTRIPSIIFEPPPAPLPPPPPAPKRKVKKPKPPRKRPAPKKATEEKSKGVVSEGGESQPTGQLSTGIPDGQVQQQRNTTAQLRQATEDNLNSLRRQLSDAERGVVQQIRNMLQQSKSAENDGDTERAYVLATKAHLLSEELVKR